MFKKVILNSFVCFGGKRRNKQVYQNANFKWQIIIFIHKKILKGKKQSKFTSQRFVSRYVLFIVSKQIWELSVELDSFLCYFISLVCTYGWHRSNSYSTAGAWRKSIIKLQLLLHNSIEGYCLKISRTLM